MAFEGLSSVCAKLEPASSKNDEIVKINVLQKFTSDALWALMQIDVMYQYKQTVRFQDIHIFPFNEDSSIDFGIYLHAIFHSVFTFTVQSPQNLRSNPYNRKSENGS